MACKINTTRVLNYPSDQYIHHYIHQHLTAPNLKPTLYLSITFRITKKLRVSYSSWGLSRRSRLLSMNAQMKTEQTLTDDRMQVIVPPHPLIKHWVSVLRNEETSTPAFRNAMADLGRLLIYEATNGWLPLISGEVHTPMTRTSVEFIDPREPVVIIPILRAGLALAEHASSLLPATKTYHLGMSRDEETLKPSLYLNKLPDKFSDKARILVVDPMLATGGTVIAALELIKKRGVSNEQIKVVSAVAAPPALENLSQKFPGLLVYAGVVDHVVNENGFIIPGLGDAGDRCFGT